MLPPEGPEEDGDDLVPPLPPEDRLWRHPSELGAAALATPAAAAPATRAPRGTSPWLVGAVAGLTGAVATLATVVAFGGFDEGAGVERTVVERVAVAPTATLPVSIGEPPDGEAGVAGVTAGISPAVVRVEVTRAPAEGSDDETTTTGSAVAFRDDGYLLTSADLVDHSVAVVVVLGDGTPRDGRVIGTDPLTDVAVVQVDLGTDTARVPTAVLGSVDDLAVGQPTLIVGSGGGTGGGPAVTSGIVSALGRSLPATGTAPTRHDLIQTDAPLDPSATGGALVDRRGAVVGITTDPPDETAGGLSFAIPIDTARAVADEIILTGTAHHAWLGIEGSDVEARRADDLQLAGGAQVATVAEGSPADVAGLAPDDVITSVDAVTVTSMADLVVELRRHEPGATILIAFVRDGRPGFAVARLGERA